ncbi:structural protein [Xenorhabdus griffiniae]|uniref:structural protein n=1 Tax=Xenorhabdus griffiniae TaxID=351672 RepID=UPI002359D477|nr:structural protein [Xenorhabdus griffiniae]MDC9607336.1 structural protein [Xenorhabdus griffiniae]
MSRGIRNHNPGNIDYNPKNDWQGQVGIETGAKNPRFCLFKSPEYGIRALMKLLINYHKGGHNSVSKIINRYAPSNENNTTAYINGVSEAVNVDPNQVLDINKPTLIALAKAIIRHENGNQPYSEATFEKAFEML